MGVLRIDSPSDYNPPPLWHDSSLLTNLSAHYALGSGFQLARASGPLGWNDEERVIDDVNRAVLKEKLNWAGMTKEKTSGNANSAEPETKVRLAGMTK